MDLIDDTSSILPFLLLKYLTLNPDYTNEIYTCYLYRANINHFLYNTCMDQYISPKCISTILHSWKWARVFLLEKSVEGNKNSNGFNKLYVGL